MSFARLVCALERHVKSISASLLATAKGSVYPFWGWTPDKSRIFIGGNVYIEQWRLEVAEATLVLFHTIYIVCQLIFHYPSADSLCETSCPQLQEDPAIMAPKSSKGKATPAVYAPSITSHVQSVSLLIYSDSPSPAPDRYVV